jgi:hypothetical protein
MIKEGYSVPGYSETHVIDVHAMGWLKVWEDKEGVAYPDLSPNRTDQSAIDDF